MKNQEVIIPNKGTASLRENWKQAVVSKLEMTLLNVISMFRARISSVVTITSVDFQQEIKG